MKSQHAVRPDADVDRTHRPASRGGRGGTAVQVKRGSLGRWSTGRIVVEVDEPVGLFFLAAGWAEGRGCEEVAAAVPLLADNPSP